MSTPTPGPHGHAAKHATPSHTGATPRSVPSPALNRQHASSLSARQPKQLPGGVAMAPSLSQASNTSGGARTGAAAGLGINNAGIKIEGVSPHNHHLAHGLNFASPAGMMLDGMGMGTPAIGDPGTGLTGMGGVGMDISLSSMGISLQDRAKRDEDEERRKKLKGVLDRLGGRGPTRGTNHSGMGRVSDEGVRRVGRWAGLDVEVENRYEGKEWEGNRPIVIAGRNAVLIDLAFANHEPSKVEVTFNSEDEAVLAHASGAAQVLMQDLAAKDNVALINTRLDDFASNLQRLATLDKLSSQSLNCVDALTGIYQSLKKLYEHEKQIAVALYSDTDNNQAQSVERDVMNKRSGRPGMHVGGRVGLSLDYWNQTATGQEVHAEGLHSLELAVESSDPTTFPSVRISKDWISDRVLKPVEESTDPTDLISDKPTLDWLEPEPTLIQPSKENNDALSVDASVKQPDVRFVAYLHPPVVMPYTVATQIRQACGTSSLNISETLQLYETNLLNLPTTTRQNLNEVVTVSEQKTFVQRPDSAKDISHRTTLYVPKVDYGYTLKEIPFSHPRQIVDILPTLRQWVSFGTILRTAFPGPASPSTTMTTQAAKSGRPKTQSKKLASGKKFALDALLNGGTPAEGAEADCVPIDITISVIPPTPTMGFFFPVGDRLGSISLSVGTDGQMAVIGQDIVPDETSGDEMGNGTDGMDVDNPTLEAKRKMARALEVTGHVGVWVEWVRQRFG
ncbi:hypothetical protein KVT40_007156 [Elsinoe batatas]|uniref:Mediator of RNA polymerase II transcription subunit 1 n=1 Tax=Elsinoe batatas TaxID=2601811 RepID=A0A8K0L0V3_9PEZI|nr:hypothetical protein KVT40_007156 [Elsinoe batatas]